MSKKQRKLLTLCMIVKNEEKYISQCIDSAFHLVDEIVIVDTGSTDKTLEILKQDKYKDKMSIYHHAWENNFSKARNQSLGYIKTEWAFTMDADEELFLRNSMSEIRKQFEEIPKKVNAVGFNIENYDLQKTMFMNHTSIKVFRNGSTHYIRRIHNQPIFKGEVAILDSFYLKHYGFDRTEKGEKKKAKERIIPLLLESIKDDPNDLESYFYLGQAHSMIGDIDKAIEYNEKYVDGFDKAKEEGRGFSPSSFYTLTKNYLFKENYKKATETLLDAIGKFPNYIDLHFLMVELGAKLGQPQLVEDGSAKYIQLYNEHSKTKVNTSGSFIFSHNTAGITFVLRILGIVRVKQGLNTLTMLGRTIADMDEEKRMTIKNMVANDLKEIPQAVDFLDKGIFETSMDKMKAA